MSKQFEELSKSLASGISRRKAFGRFAAGIGAVVGGLIFRRPARADKTAAAFCLDFCRDVLHLTGMNLVQCSTNCWRQFSINNINNPG